MVKRGENIYKRKDNRWEGRYIKGRKKDGSIHYGYLYSDNYTDLKRELIIKKAKSYNELNITNDILFLYWAEHWLSNIKEKVKISTYTSYRYKMDRYILPYLGEVNINLITNQHIESWKNKLLSFLSANSTKVMFQIMNKCMSDAVDKKILLKNPCRDSVAIKNLHVETYHLNYDEHRILNKIAYSEKNGLAIALALESGMRIGEISGLKWEDVNLENSTITIKRTVQRIYSYDSLSKSKTIVIEGPPKSSSSCRIIPISKKMNKYLSVSNSKIPSYYVFGAKKPSEPRKINKWLKHICEKNNLKYVHFHELRHSFAKQCLTKGVNITTTSKLLGHKSVKMTLDMYTHASMYDKKKAIETVTSN
ncbi:tyrosine-type recombinase/integrase [Enterococcus faecalis]|uniref:tyrosine-type recombinase/integrase n=1 Tax=Enterococcus faecalis TaxID=1351 RepID=UPI0034CDD667